MNTFLIIAIAAVIFLYLLMKMSHFRARISFIFILIGILVIIFMVYIFVSGTKFSFSSIDGIIASGKGYFLWIKGVVTNIFQFTGKAIGTAANNSTIAG